MLDPRRGTRKRETEKLTLSLAAQKADDDGNPFIDGPKKTRAKAPRVKAIPESVSEQEDDDFDLPDLLEASDSEASDDEMEIDHDEVGRDLFTLFVLTGPPRSLPFCRRRRSRAAPIRANPRLRPALLPLRPKLPPSAIVAPRLKRLMTRKLLLL